MTHGDIPQSGTVLVVGAHPDDLEFFAGGTIARLVNAGVHVDYLFATNGESGAQDPALPNETVAQVRRAEQQAAGDRLGVREIHYLGHVDGLVESSRGLRDEIVSVLRRVRPEVVISFDPRRLLIGSYIVHPDHRATAASTIDAVWPAAANPRYRHDLLGHLEPHKVTELWLMTPTEPNHAVDISTVVNDKTEALSEHRSQNLDGASQRPRIVAEARRAGERFGLPLAEDYQRIVINALD